MKSWIIVHFFGDKSVEAVPNFWYKDKLCVWPNKKSIVKQCIIKRYPITEFEHKWLKI